MFLEILAWVILIGWFAIVVLIITAQKWLLPLYVKATLDGQEKYEKLMEWHEKLKGTHNGI